MNWLAKREKHFCFQVIVNMALVIEILFILNVKAKPLPELEINQVGSL